MVLVRLLERPRQVEERQEDEDTLGSCHGGHCQPLSDFSRPGGQFREAALAPGSWLPAAGGCVVASPSPASKAGKRPDGSRPYFPHRWSAYHLAETTWHNTF